MHTFSKLLLTHCGDRSLPNSHCLSYTSVTAISLLPPQRFFLGCHPCLSGCRMTKSFWPQCLCGHDSCVTCSRPPPRLSPCRCPFSESSYKLHPAGHTARCPLYNFMPLDKTVLERIPQFLEVKFPYPSAVRRVLHLSRKAITCLCSSSRAWPCCYLVIATAMFY